MCSMPAGIQLPTSEGLHSVCVAHAIRSGLYTKLATDISTQCHAWSGKAEDSLLCGDKHHSHDQKQKSSGSTVGLPPAKNVRFSSRQSVRPAIEASVSVFGATVKHSSGTQQMNASSAAETQPSGTPSLLLLLLKHTDTLREHTHCSSACKAYYLERDVRRYGQISHSSVHCIACECVANSSSCSSFPATVKENMLCTDRELICIRYTGKQCCKAALHSEANFHQAFAQQDSSLQAVTSQGLFSPNHWCAYQRHLTAGQFCKSLQAESL